VPIEMCLTGIEVESTMQAWGKKKRWWKMAFVEHLFVIQVISFLVEKF